MQVPLMEGRALRGARQDACVQRETSISAHTNTDSTLLRWHLIFCDQLSHQVVNGNILAPPRARLLVLLCL